MSSLRVFFARIGLLAASFAACMTAAAAAANPAALPPFETIVAQFEDVAFGHEHGASQGVVQKWTEMPSLALYRAADYDINPYLRAIIGHFKAISELTGVKISTASAPEGATLRLGFYPRSDFGKMPGRKDDPEFRRWVATSACIAIAVNDSEEIGRIKAGAIAIGTDIPEQQRQHCILEEIVQVMGLPNDACHYRPSLFCEYDRVFSLTPADAILLRTLYDRRLPAGMKKDEARPIVRQIIAERMAETAPTLAKLP